MKKLKLTTSVFDKGEVLTRTQLKKILGGDGSGDGGGETVPNCSSGPCDYVYYDNLGQEQKKHGSCMIQVIPGSVLEKEKYNCYCSASGPIPVNYNGTSHCQLN